MHRLFDLHIRGKQLLIIEELPLFFRCQTPQLLLSEPSVWGSCLPPPLPLTVIGSSRLLVSKRPGPFAFSVCGRGWEGSFLKALCLAREWDLSSGGPSGHPLPSPQPMIFFSSRPHQPELTQLTSRSWKLLATLVESALPHRVLTNV